jgi:FxsC-like protein
VVPQVGGEGGAGHAPYFFLSYAHTPKHDPSDDPDLWIFTLFHDLCRHIMHLTNASSWAEAGFMDRRVRHGADWRRQLSNALATCRVFVPLYSPRYCVSAQCGREWFAISRRLRDHEARGNQRAEIIIPALWAPVQEAEIPEPVRAIQFDHSAFGRRYAERGFHGIIKLKRYRADYEEAVFELARRIVDAARLNTVAPATPVDYESLHSAFGSPAAPRAGDGRVRVTVVASDTSNLPAGRGAYHYGPTPLDWNPYRPDCVCPLAEYAADIVGDLDCQPDVGTLDDHDDLLADGPPTSPTVLLIDVWSADSPKYRDSLRQLDEIDKPWISVLVPWNQSDVETAAAEPRLRRSLEEVLRRRLHEGRFVSRTAVGGIATLEQFGIDLPKMVHAATRQYFKNATVYPPAGPAVKRPRLRGPEAGTEPEDPERNDE